MNESNCHIAAILKFVDDDIKNEFLKPIALNGAEHPAFYYMNSPALTMATVQLARVIREGFNRGFVVKE